MAEALVSSILEQLTAITIEHARQELKLVTDVEKEVEKLDSTLKAIRGILEDAEQRQIVEKNVKGWLEKLKEASYDVEDVLDEWSTALSKLQTDPELDVSASIPKRMKTSFVSWVSSFLQVFRRRDIGSKIKAINERLDEIAKAKDRYHLTKRETKQFRRVESTSFIDVSKLHGRDEIKKEIVEKLLNGTSDDGCIQTISLVGMGGIGKTTLAKYIFNDHQVRAHFNNAIWVCVSDHFDRNKIAVAILRHLDRGSVTNLQKPIPLQDILIKICEKIRSAKFLLVLDDVWTDRDEDWEPLKAAFQQGMSGSKILVTTRKESVAMGMGSSQVFHLEELSDEVCWLILSQLAFMGKENELRENLEGIGQEIAKKCKGLPLAAKTLGGLLQEKNTRNEWQIILNSEIWKLNVAQQDIFRPLLLSYYDLPSQIRPCLLYCAIFPKDFVFWSTELIKHWMAHGYLNTKENFGMEEKKGGEYFNYLACCSFFQDFDKDEDGNIIKCKMHDMVHDFLQYLTKEEIVSVEVDSSENVRLDLSSKKTHHLRVNIAKGDQFPVSIEGIEKLRSLVAVGEECDVTGEALQAFFKGAKFLRLLDFCMGNECSCANVKEIPDEIGMLIHLRYLNLSCSETLKELPEVVCELHNLQYLDLFGCINLEKLPEGIGKLIKLRYLRTDGCESLQYYPKGIGRLTSLRELTRVIARVDGNDAKEFSVGDLENLNLLRGTLWIEPVGNVLDVEEAKRAKLHKNEHLNCLVIFNKGRGPSVRREDYIQALNAPPGLTIEFSMLPFQEI
ncbi:putative disease resistance protein RGA3 isoform X1 [Durio zibethinus]|uniref:Disease resistance protein RGA3 isoform X1 n=1 Tax=Durio zibethinus TaxID=66656 RepID=A0A6P6BB14_DURZI|nr:putative disease resistance protein RGA3 isoform X1 [Durio zibethinus]